MEPSCFGFEEDEDDAVVSNRKTARQPSPVNIVKPVFRFVCKSKAACKTAVQNVPSPGGVSSPAPENPVSITQVQELLLQGMSDDESPTRNSSFYEEVPNKKSEDSDMNTPVKNKPIKNTPVKNTPVKNTPVRARIGRKKKPLEKDDCESENDENTENFEKTPARVYAKPAQTKRPLGDIQNFDRSLTAIPENAPQKKGKAKKAEKPPIRVFTRPNRKRDVENIENSDDTTITVAKPVVKRKGKKQVENERKEQIINELQEQINSKFKAVEEYQLVVE